MLLDIKLNYSNDISRTILVDLNIISAKDMLIHIERELIIDSFLKCRGKLKPTALHLRMNRATVSNRLVKYGLFHDGGGLTDLYYKLQQEYINNENYNAPGEG